MRRALGTIAMIAALSATTIPAAAMTFAPAKLKSGRAIIATGDIEPGDGERFRQMVKDGKSDGALLVLSSDGGSVSDGMDIGRAAWRAGMATMVAPSSKCLSACFLAFSGGRTRHVPDNAALGSHQFYREDDDQIDGAAAMKESQSLAGDMLYFVSQTGVDPQALTFILQTPSENMFVFSPEMLKRFRLEQLEPRDSSAAMPAYLSGGPKRPGCDFPDSFLANDPLGLLAACR
jgi:hypothetical protein